MDKVLLPFSTPWFWHSRAEYRQLAGSLADFLCVTQEEDILRYHVILGEKLLKNDLHNGMHRETMMGFSYLLGFFLHNDQVHLLTKLKSKYGGIGVRAVTGNLSWYHKPNRQSSVSKMEGNFVSQNNLQDVTLASVNQESNDMHKLLQSN